MLNNFVYLYGMTLIERYFSRVKVQWRLLVLNCYHQKTLKKGHNSSEKKNNAVYPFTLIKSTTVSTNSEWCQRKLAHSSQYPLKWQAYFTDDRMVYNIMIECRVNCLIITDFTIMLLWTMLQSLLVRKIWRHRFNQLRRDVSQTGSDSFSSKDCRTFYDTTGWRTPW